MTKTAINDNNVLKPVNIGLTIVEPTTHAPVTHAPVTHAHVTHAPAPQITTQPVPHVHIHTAIEIEHIEDEIDGYIDKINTDIGFYWWKRYIYSAFWSNVSTPINLSIIILTALTTGENATKNLIGQEIATILGIAVLFVSIFNTFFRPNEQLAQNQKIMSEWATVGGQFDEIYYDRVYTAIEKAARLKSLEKLFKSLSVLKRTNDTNYLIDLIFMVIRFLCIRKNIKWILITDNVSVGREKRLTLTMRRQSNYVGMNETHV